MIGTKTAGESPLVVVGTGTGVTLIPSPTQLTRLNYFDGKFLRAEDLSAEQAYLRSLVQLSNQAGGAGVVHGFDTRLGAGGALELGPGLGIDRAGRVLLLPHPTSVGVAELIERSRNPAAGSAAAKKAGSALFGGCAEPAAGPPPATSVLPAELYLVVLGHAEALCGEEDVYGKLCEDACSPDTNRRYRVEGVVLRAVPVSLDPPTTPFPNAARKHLRSLAASAYFATERARLGREMSGARLRQDLWCHPAPLEHWPTEAGEGIPLALLSVTGGTVEWLDMWTARRDRMEPPARKGWAWQMMMRPWEVFLAQVLQFQCQLTDLLAGTPTGGGSDPCEENRRVLERARAILERIERRYENLPETVVTAPPPPAAMPAPPAAAPAAFAKRSAKQALAQEGEVVVMPGYGQTQDRPEYLPELAELRKEILVALDEGGAPGSARVLVDGGIVELPAAGYLPVVPGREVDEQVRQLLGDGVDLRFCAVRPDYVAHALEEAQHMDRIGLLQGLEDPAKRPEVDVLVPDGELIEKQVAPAGRLFEVTVRRAKQPTLSAGPVTAGDQQQAAGTTTTSEGEDGDGDGGGDTDQAKVLLRGAGRSQRLANGGGAFHFAGVSGLLERISIPKDPTSGGTDTPNTADATLRSFMAGRTGSGTKSGTGFRVPRVPGIGEALGWMFRGVRTAGPAAQEAQPDAADAATMERATAAGMKRRMQARELQQITTPKLSTPSLENVTLGVWASMRCEGDPFALEVGESVPVRAEVVVGIDGVVIDGEPVPAWARGRIVGDLVCRVPADGGNKMRARLEGAAFGHTRKLGDPADGGDGSGDADGSGDQEGSVPLDMRVDLELRPVLGGGSELVATLFIPTADSLLAVSIATSWRGSPILAQSVAAMELLVTVNELLKTATGDQRQVLEAMKKSIQEGRFPATLPVLAATARENPAVADAGNPYHADAVRALKALGRVLEDPGFREGAERLLFPPPPKQSGAARVRATRDWVLFHRRRRSSCDCCPGAAVAAPPRRYRVYHAALDDDPSPEEIRKALAGDDPPEEGDDFLQPLGVALEFEGGSATMLTARGALLDAWRDAGPAPRLLYGAIAGAGAGAGDSDALLDGRLDRVVAAVETETPEYPGAAFDVLDRVPSWIPAGASDGVVVLLTTRAGAPTECQEVFLVRRSENNVSAMRTFLEQGGSRADLEAFAEVVGKVRYQPGTATVVGESLDQLVEDWGAKEPGIPGEGICLTPATANQPDVRARHEQRANDVLEALGRQFSANVDDLPSGVTECDSVLLIVAGNDPSVGTATVLHRVIETDSADVQKRLVEAMAEKVGNNVLKSLQGEVRPLGYVRFAAGTSNAEQPSLDDVVAASGGGGSPDTPFLVTPGAATQAQAGQAEVIRDALGVTAAASKATAALAGNEMVYGDAQVVTVVVPG